MSQSFSTNTGLSALPEYDQGKDPQAYAEFLRLRNAFQVLQAAIDGLGGAGGAVVTHSTGNFTQGQPIIAANNSGDTVSMVSTETAGYVMTSAGPGLLPIWAAPSGGGLSPIADKNILSNISGASAIPVGNTLSALIDSILGNTQGQLITRNAGGWTVLGPSTGGNVLTENGAGANLSWNTPSGGAGDYVQPLVSIEQAVITGQVLTSSSYGHQYLCTTFSTDYTMTLPAPLAGKFISFRMAPGNTHIVQILAPSGSLIDGLQSRYMWTSETAVLYCDGTNWTKISGKSIPMECWLYKSADQTGLSSGAQVQVAFDKTQVDNTGFMFDSANHRIKFIRPGKYIVNFAVWADPGVVAYTRLQATVRHPLNSNIFTVDATAALSGGYDIAASSFIWPVVFGDWIDLTGTPAFSGGSGSFICSNTWFRTHLSVFETNLW